MAKTIDITKASAITGWMTEEELTWLAEQASERDLIVEMGSFLGRSTRALGDHAKGTVYAWDHWMGPDESWWRDLTSPEYIKQLLPRFKANLSDLLEQGKVKILNMAHECPIPSELAYTDMVFIDGDHTYEGARRDIRKWLPLKPSRLLCGHDFNQRDVRRAVQELLPVNEATAGNIWSCKG